MFSRDISHYRPAPRTLDTSKFGPYAKLCPVERRREAVSVACFLAAIIVATAAAITTAMILFIGVWGA